MFYYKCIYTVIMLSILSSYGYVQQCVDDPNLQLPTALASYQLVHFQNINTVYIFGGFNGYNRNVSSSAIYKWNMSNVGGRFQKIEATTPTPSFWSWTNNVAKVGNKAYFAGVYTGTLNSEISGIYVFDSLKEKFVPSDTLSRPLYPSIRGCVTTNGSHIFMVGGIRNLNASSALNVLQIYDITKNEWTVEEIQVNNTTINDGFSEQYCQIVDQVLYVFGGILNHWKATNRCYKYDVRENKWDYLVNKSIKSSNGATVYYNNEIYMIGGWYPQEQNILINSNMMDIFNVGTQQIVTKSVHMIYSLSAFSALVIDDSLYTFGGYNGNTKDAIRNIQVCPIIHQEQNAEQINFETYTVIFCVGLICLIAFSTVLFLYLRKSKQSVMYVSNPMVIAIGIGQYDEEVVNPDFDGYCQDLDAVDLDIKNVISMCDQTNFNYDVFTKDIQLHWTENELDGFLKEKAKHLNNNLGKNKKYDGLIVIISGHGIHDYLLSSDYKQISKDYMHRIFSTTYPDIRTVPRLFLYDCCNGSFERAMRRRSQISQISTFEEMGDVTKTGDIGKRKELVDIEKHEVIWAKNEHNPDHMLIIVNASNTGFLSFMNNRRGSYMINRFVKKMLQNIKKRNKKFLFEIMDEIQDELQGKQLPEIKYNNRTRFLKFIANRNKKKSEKVTDVYLQLSDLNH